MGIFGIDCGCGGLCIGGGGLRAGLGETDASTSLLNGGGMLLSVCIPRLLLDTTGGK